MNIKNVFVCAMATSMLLPVALEVGGSVVSSAYVSADTETINGISADEYNYKVQEMVYLLNQYRVSNGLAELKTCDTMNTLAQARAKEQEITGMSHYRPNGSKYSSIFSEYNVSVSYSGENLLAGLTDTQMVLDSWKTSEGHNANMLGDYQYVGIGLINIDGTYYWLQLFCQSTDTKITENAYLAEMPVAVTTTEATTTVETTTTEATTTTIETTTTESTEVTHDPAYDGYNFDVNNDNEVNSVDLLLLKKRLLGMI